MRPRMVLCNVFGPSSSAFEIHGRGSVTQASEQIPSFVRVPCDMAKLFKHRIHCDRRIGYSYATATENLDKTAGEHRRRVLNGVHVY
ncbi:hypothetical protein CBM2637_B110314 [Cupriavidus taiwanensis]|nr:hypothetical protein CBM2637_B110314 [Cupriavidus taiwanensis]